MVSFISITQGVFLISIMALFTEAAPAAGSKSAHRVAPHTNATAIESFKFPPIISSRTKSVKNPGFIGDLDAETESIEKNKKWFLEHGGSLESIEKRENNLVGGIMTLEVPENAPPGPKMSKAASVVIATTSQVNTFKSYAGIAATSYCDSVVPKGLWGCKNCLKYVPDGKLIVTFTSAKGDINGFVLRSESQKTIHLVFRGTSSFSNWIVNIKFELTNYSPVKGAKVHTGFLGSYKEVAPSFFDSVRDQLTAYPDYKVAISGHSLGGAQAILAGLDLYQRDKRFNANNLNIYTVGCPRVGNPAFAYYVDSTGIPVIRSVHDRDVVPHVPPQMFDYLHPGVEVWDRDSLNNIQMCTSNIETNSCSNSIVPFTSISDHSTYYGIAVSDCS